MTTLWAKVHFLVTGKVKPQDGAVMISDHLTRLGKLPESLEKKSSKPYSLEEVQALLAEARKNFD